MKVIIISIVLLALAFAGIAIKILVKRMDSFPALAAVTIHY
jgi:hypothetical protein